MTSQKIEFQREAIPRSASEEPVAPLPTDEAVRALFDEKYGDPESLGPVPRLWRRWGYLCPDDYYEATVAKLVTDGISWMEVGCGRSIFPHNPSLSRRLAGRCGYLLGVDPDPSIHDNPFVNESQQTTLEGLCTDRQFDLVTLRMVVEHLTSPSTTLASLARLVKPGGLVVVYTVNRRSPTSRVAAISPFRWHHPIKRLLWRTKVENTFPVTYLLNTRRSLVGAFRNAGFQERAFRYLGDCRTFYRFPWIHALDIALWRTLNRINITHPENCLLAIFTRA